MSTVNGKLILLVGMALLCAAMPLSAQVKTEKKSFERNMKVSRIDDRLEISLDFPEVFIPRMRHRLSNGFTSRILIDVFLVELSRDIPVAGTTESLTILYDLWEERFHVREESPGVRREYKLKSIDELVRFCGTIQRFPLSSIQDLPVNKSYRFEVRITVNPASLEQKNRVRDYLANPNGGGHLGASPRSFFGSFSRIFVSEKDIQADAIFTYHSPAFPMPPKPKAD